MDEKVAFIKFLLTAGAILPIAAFIGITLYRLWGTRK